MGALYYILSPSHRCAGSRSTALRDVVAEEENELMPLVHHDAVLALRTLLEHLISAERNLRPEVCFAASMRRRLETHCIEYTRCHGAGCSRVGEAVAVRWRCLPARVHDRAHPIAQNLKRRIAKLP